uniref:Uncharacterized protein n=1 Tax=Triticum urartu TaxID=4572 RepID=A0A8R7UYG5_TRIUA
MCCRNDDCSCSKTFHIRLQDMKPRHDHHAISSCQEHHKSMQILCNYTHKRIHFSKKILQHRTMHCHSNIQLNEIEIVQKQ